MVFISVVNAALGGLLVATIAGTLSAPTAIAVVLGVLYGLAYFLVSAARGKAGYSGVWRTNTPHNPTPTE